MRRTSSGLCEMRTVEARLFVGVVGGASETASVFSVPSMTEVSIIRSAGNSPIDSLSDPDVYTSDGVEDFGDQRALDSFLEWDGMDAGSSGIGLCGWHVVDSRMHVC